MANYYHSRWPTDAIPGRTREELAAAGAASIIAPNAQAMRVELAIERDRAAVAALKARVDEINQDAALAREFRK